MASVYFGIPLQTMPVHRLTRACLTALLLSAALRVSAQEGPQKLAAIRLSAGIHNIQAEVAHTPEQRAIGLMNRPTLAASDGMLFVFETAATQCFWMKNTLIPLSIAFVADDGRIDEITDMLPKTLESHCSAKPARLVLEMNQGWFTRHGIKAGDRLSGAVFER